MCNWSEIFELEIISFVAFTTTVTFFLHAVAYGKLLQRIGRSKSSSFLLGILPSIGTSISLVVDICPQNINFIYLCIMIFFMAWLVHFSVFLYFFNEIFPARIKQGVKYRLNGGMCAIIGTPFFGPFFSLIWIISSWGLPELIQIRRGESENPLVVREYLLPALIGISIVLTYIVLSSYLAMMDVLIPNTNQ